MSLAYCNQPTVINPPYFFTYENGVDSDQLAYQDSQFFIHIHERTHINNDMKPLD